MKSKNILTAFSILFMGISLVSCGTSELKIVTQPVEIQHCDIPDGYSVEVKVNDENLVKSYAWQYNNAVREEKQDWIYLTGEDATKAKYTCVSSKSNDHYHEYRCEITGKDGTVIYSDSSKIYFDNKYSYEPVVYVGDYAVKGGQTLDLSTTSLGTGKVSLNEVGSVVTLDHVNIDNTVSVKKSSEGSICFEMLSYGYPFKDFTVNVVGDNKVLNTFWQPSHNASGIPFCFNFMRKFEGDIPVIENVLFTGDGTLSIAGGTHLIYANTKVTVDCDMIFGTVEDHYGTGIYADDIEFTEGVSISGKLNGYICLAEKPHYQKDDVNGNVTINKDVKIVVESKSPVVSAGASVMSLICAYKNVNITDATISLNEITLAERYAGHGGIGEIVGIKSQTGNVNIINSVVDATFNATKYDSHYASNCGFIVADRGTVNIDNSELSSSVDTPYITGGNLIYGKQGISITDSSVRGKAYLKGIVEGLSCNGLLSIDNSQVVINIYSYDYSQATKGVITTSMAFGNNVQFDINAVEGIAISVQVGAGDEPKEFDPEYVPSVLNAVTITEPKNHVINLYSMQGSIHDYVYMETIFDSQDTTKPASKVSFFKN